MITTKVRIKDIAKMAGVSEGTVDRVLHNRGNVSSASAERVLKVIGSTEYKPNLIARTLGANKTFRIAALVPDPKSDPYWAHSFEGLTQAASEWAQFGITTEEFYFDRHDKDSFLRASLEVFHSKPDGVLAAPLFYYAAIPLFKVLRESKIPYVQINTYIAEAEPLSFVGQDAFQSGELGAELLFYGHRSPCTYVIAHIQVDIENSIHLIEKEKGFKSFFSHLEDKSYDVITINLPNPDTVQFEEQLTQLLATPKLKGIFVSNSKAFSVARILEKLNRIDIRLVGYDLMEENLTYLRAGKINALINQNQKRQARIGMNTLANYLLHKTVGSGMSLLPLEIITRKNLDSYLSSDNLTS